LIEPQELTFAAKHQAICDGKQNAFHTRIGAKFLVKVINGLCGLILRIHNPTVLEHVVEND
jgi:hypothetical protein